MSFNFTAENDTINAIINATLWTNISGWLPNQTISNIISGQQASINVTNISEGGFIWNIEVCDTSGTCTFAEFNKTITIDRTNPTISSFTLSSSKINIGDTITSICYANDNIKGAFTGIVTGIK